MAPCRYILSITNEDEIREYVVDLVQGTDGKKGWFVEELLNRWRKSAQLPSEPFPAYRKKDGEWCRVENSQINLVMVVTNNSLP